MVDRVDDDLDWVETTSAKVATYKDGRWLFENGTWRVKDVSMPSGLREEPFTQKWVDIPEKPEEFALEDKETDDMT